MKTSHSIPASRISKPSWYNKFREQNSLLNQSSSKILLTGGSIISSLRRYLVIWKKYSSSFNSLNFGIPGDKIRYVLWKIQNFSNNSSIKYIFILCRTSNIDYNPPEEPVNGITLSGISAKKQCHNVVFIPLIPQGKKDTIRRGSIHITNWLLEEESGKHD